MSVGFLLIEGIELALELLVQPRDTDAVCTLKVPHRRVLALLHDLNAGLVVLAKFEIDGLCCNLVAFNLLVLDLVLFCSSVVAKNVLSLASHIPLQSGCTTNRYCMNQQAPHFHIE